MICSAPADRHKAEDIQHKGLERERLQQAEPLEDLRDWEAKNI